jgi:putative two-component system response regulator
MNTKTGIDHQFHVVIVDDMAVNITLLTSLIHKLGDYDVRGFNDPLEAWAWCQHAPVDLLLLDYMMPEMNGLVFLQKFKTLLGKKEVPVVMITANDQRTVRYEALNLGATDFLTKPIDAAEFTARFKTLAALREHNRIMDNASVWLAQEVRKATAEIYEREHAALFALSKAAEFRDPEIGAHVIRMAHYSYHIARALGLPEDECLLIQRAAALHDIGKIGTPDEILLKPAPLTDDERMQIKRHASYGFEILRHSQSEVMQVAAIIAYAHHERWDGLGYPRRLVGEETHIYGRIVAVADVFDAITSNRVYKKAESLEVGKDYLIAHAGTQFDPQCVAAFMACWDEIVATHHAHQDRGEGMEEF